MRCSTANKKLVWPAAVAQKTFSKIHHVESYSEYFPDRKSHFISELLDGSSLEEDSLLSLLLWFLLSTHGNLNLPSLGNCQVDYSQQYAHVLGCRVIFVIFNVLVWWVGGRGAIIPSRQELYVCYCYFCKGMCLLVLQHSVCSWLVRWNSWREALLSHTWLETPW